MICGMPSVSIDVLKKVVRLVDLLQYIYSLYKQDFPIQDFLTSAGETLFAPFGMETVENVFHLLTEKSFEARLENSWKLQSNLVNSRETQENTIMII